MPIRVKNRGTGAGGKNTTKNGHKHEKNVSLSTEFNVIKQEKLYDEIVFKGYSRVFKFTKKAKFKKLMESKEDKRTPPGHGCKHPDECYIDETRKIIFILEHKYQQCSGSVCEKIQSGDFKVYNYSLRYPDYKIEYMYILSSWFLNNCQAALEYLEKKNIKVFFNNKPDFKNDICKVLN